jgi:hypothetical protein
MNQKFVALVFNPQNLDFSKYSTGFCVLMTEIWFLLFFHIPASKLQQLLIKNIGGLLSLRAADKPKKSNRNQRDVAIRTFEFSSASKAPRQKTNLFKRRRAVTSRRRHRGVLSLRAADTNRIQREFLFNNCIQSYTAFSASSHPRQKTNLLKQSISAPLSLRSGDRG